MVDYRKVVSCGMTVIIAVDLKDMHGLIYRFIARLSVQILLRE